MVVELMELVLGDHSLGNISIRICSELGLPKSMDIGRRPGSSSISIRCNSDVDFDEILETCSETSRELPGERKMERSNSNPCELVHAYDSIVVLRVCLEYASISKEPERLSLTGASMLVIRQL